MNNYILELKEELIVSLPGFIISMIHGLDTIKEDERKPIEEILEKTQKIVGTSRFFGEMWKTMLRSTKCCEHAIKYLDRKIPKNPREAMLKADKIYLS